MVGDALATWSKALEGLIPITIWGFLVLMSEDVPSSSPADTSKPVCAEMDTETAQTLLALMHAFVTSCPRAPHLLC